MINKIAFYLPPGTLTNEGLASAFPEWTPAKIFEKTGISTRHVVSDNENTSDLAVAAARQLLAENKQAVPDALICCTQTPDSFLPPMSCALQSRLELPSSTAAFDINLGCSGYVYSLAVIKGLFAAKLAKSALLINADTYTRLLHPDDKSTRAIFGDAAAASLCSESGFAHVHSFVFGTDGSGANQLCCKIPAQPFNSPKNSEKLCDPATGNEGLWMNGPEVFNFTLRAVPEMVEKVLAAANARLNDIDLFVFHQANAFMLEHLRRKLNIPREKFLVSLEHFGNTVSATIPIALEEARRRGLLKTGMRTLLAGFGVGLSWAGCIFDNHTLQ